MRKLLLHFLLLASAVGFAQDKAYQSSEDALTKLINNPEFVDDVLKLGTQEVNAANIDQYLTKYVPEYAGYKIKNNIDFDKLYYANVEDVAPEMVADKLGGLLQLNPAQSQHMKNTLSGNLSYTPTNNLSSGISSKLYDRGKDAKVDYAVDYAVDFFQGEFGDGGMNSALIDIGGGLLGNLLSSINKQDEEKIAKERILSEALNDYNVYNCRGNWPDYKPTQQDLFLHGKAEGSIYRVYTTNAGLDYDAAIKMLDEAIVKYKQNPLRAYYLYRAYLTRGKCKMHKGAYRAAIIDYYLAQGVLTAIQKGELPDRSVKTVWPDGYFDSSNKKTFMKAKFDFSLGNICDNDLVNIIISRAYAKYRLNDYPGAISDCHLANTIPTIASGIPNDYKDIIAAIKAMAEFGQKNFEQSYLTFAGANLDDQLISDNDNDGITDFLDLDKKGVPYIIDTMENLGSIELYGLPEYFPFDIAQIRGLAYFKANKKDEAITIYENILHSENDKLVANAEKKLFTKIGGDVSTVYGTLGNFYMSKGDKTKALECFNRAITINPNPLEYYMSRANCKRQLGDTKGADSDMAIVKNPKLLNVAKKSEEYYMTKFVELSAAKNDLALVDVMRDASVLYPHNPIFFSELVNAAKAANNPEKTLAAAQAVSANKARSAIMNSIYSGQIGDKAKQEETILTAFESGVLDLLSCRMYPLQITTQPYYCKLLSRYATKNNNSFVGPGLDKEKMVKMLDSTYNAVPAYANAKGSVKKILDNTKRREIAKATGNIEEYLKALDDDKNLTESLPFHALDKIECLFILEKDAEAIKFAKKIVADGKIKPTPGIAPNDDPAIAIYNIASGDCK